MVPLIGYSPPSNRSSCPFSRSCMDLLSLLDSTSSHRLPSSYIGSSHLSSAHVSSSPCSPPLALCLFWWPFSGFCSFQSQSHGSKRLCLGLGSLWGCLIKIIRNNSKYWFSHCHSENVDDWGDHWSHKGRRLVLPYSGWSDDAPPLGNSKVSCSK